MNLRILSETLTNPLRKPWKNAIAVGRAYELLRADVIEHLRFLQKTIGYKHCRFHGLFHDEMAVVTRKADGKLAYRWHQVDKIYDTLLELGLKPFVELNPMPAALASGTETIFDWRMNVTPPKDYEEWGQLIKAFICHIRDRYGIEEVRTWYFEVWNEPNLNGFWTGSKQDYWRLYEASAFAIKSVDSALRVGGPASSKASWIRDIIDHCDKNKVPIDFVSTHLYPQDEYVDYVDRKESPHSIGAFFSDTVRRIQSEVRNSARPTLEIHWTEWNTLATDKTANISWTENTTVDSLYGAALVCKLCTELDENANTLCWWVATDIFEESGMPQSEFSGTYGLTTIHGIPKATFHAFEFLNRLRGPRLKLEGIESLPLGCGCVATREGVCTQVIVWNCQLLELTNRPDWNLDLSFLDIVDDPVVIESRIGIGAGSSCETWKALGSPQTLSPSEMRLVRDHSQPFTRLVPLRGKIMAIHLKPGEVLHIEITPRGQAALGKTNLRQELMEWEKRMSDRSM